MNEKEKELLMLAAKAAGIKAKWFMVQKWKDVNGAKWRCGTTDVFGTHHSKPWNPLADDGDCARLEAALGIDVAWHRMGVVATYRDTEDHEIFGHDVVVREPYADHQDRNDARRRASTELAAQVGKAMP